jgi:hypothetical protein
MNTLIRARGWITQASIIRPIQNHEDASPKFILAIQPENPAMYELIEDLAQRLKQEYTSPHDTDLEEAPAYRDRLFNGCEILFETVHKPKLDGAFREYQNDNSLIGQPAQIVGHMQIHKFGNVYISAHIIEPAFAIDK